MGKDKTKAEKPKEEKKATDFNEDNVITEMQKLGGKNITSTQIRDAFELSKETGRGTARRKLAKLEKSGKVKIHLKKDVKRRQYLYDVVESSGPKT